jgi:hypothetical protein
MKVSGQPHTPAVLTPGNENAVTYGKRLCGPQGRSGDCGELLSLPKIDPQSFYHPAYSLVTTPTELSYMEVYSATLPA